MIFDLVKGGVTYSAERVAEAGRTFVVKGVGLAEDVGEAVFGEQRGLVDLFGDGGDGGGVVHEGVLEGYARGGSAADVAVERGAC
jgi:hypothetical protein